MNKKQGVDLKLNIHKYLNDQPARTESSRYSRKHVLQESSITRDLHELAGFDEVGSRQGKISDLRSCIKTSLHKLQIRDGKKGTPPRSTPLHFDTSRSTSVENSIRNRESDHSYESLAMKVHDLELENRFLHKAISKRDERISKLDEQVNTLASTLQNHQNILYSLSQKLTSFY